jgi:hypothetical protein
MGMGTYVMEVHFAICTGLIEEPLECLELIQMQLEVKAEIFHLSLKDQMNLLLRKSRLCIT